MGWHVHCFVSVCRPWRPSLFSPPIHSLRTRRTIAAETKIQEIEKKTMNSSTKNEKEKEAEMGAEVISIRRKFDPLAKEAESQYNRVAQRLNRLSATRNCHRRAAEELERQFAENDLIARTGPRRGMPLTDIGRRRRLRKLMDLNLELSRIEDERDSLGCELDAMNVALDAWARETYGYADSSTPERYDEAGESDAQNDV